MVFLHAYRKQGQKTPQREPEVARIRLLYNQRRFYLEVARLISSLRVKKAMTQEQLAKKAGVNQPMIARSSKAA